MKLLPITIFLSMFLGCSCSHTEAVDVLKTAKHNPKAQTCRLVRTPEEVSGVYCVTYEGPEKLR